MSSTDNLVHLAGTTLEGGGQLLRLALSLSSITRVPFRITDIRGNRPSGGGLKLQHLTAVKWLATACDAKVEGAEKGSRQLTFIPGGGDGSSTPWVKEEVFAGGRVVRNIKITQSSPGSIGLVLQAILPFLVFSDGATTSTSKSGPGPSAIHLEISGGTNVPFSPSYEYISQVLLPALERIGILSISTSLQCRGWTTGRQEMGRMTFFITPLTHGASLPAFSFTNDNDSQDAVSDLEKIDISILAPREARKLLRRETRTALDLAFPDVPTSIILDEDSQHAKRIYLLLVAHKTSGHRLGRDWLYDKKITDMNVAAQALVRTVVRELREEVQAGACVDEFLQDQLVVFQALASGRSVLDAGGSARRRCDEDDGSASSASDEEATIEPKTSHTTSSRASLHTQTAQWVAEQMLKVKFQSGDETKNQRWTGCHGIGCVVGGRGQEDIGRDERKDELVQRIQKLDIDSRSESGIVGT